MSHLHQKGIKIYSIQIRDWNFAFASYSFIITNKASNTSFKLAPTPITLIPKFNINYTQIALYNLFNSSNSIEITIDLNLTSTNEQIHSFTFTLPSHLIYTANTLQTISITENPLILFETNAGYFRLLTSSLPLTTPSNVILPNTELSTPVRESQLLNLVNARSQYMESESKLREEQLKLIESQEQLSKCISSKKLEFAKYAKFKYNLHVLQSLRFEILNKQDKIDLLKQTISQLKRYLAVKRERISKLKAVTILSSQHNKYINEIDIPKYNNICMYLQYVNRSFLKKHLIEIAGVFFNKNIFMHKSQTAYKGYFHLPPFYNQEFKVETRAMRMNFYNNYSDAYSTFFGFLISIAQYFSKKFNIVLPFCLYEKGSKSRIIMKNGSAVNLYRDEIIGSSLGTMSEGIEEGSKLMKKVLEEIMGFVNGKGVLKEGNDKERKRERSRVKTEERDNVFSLFVLFNNFVNEMVYDIGGKL